MDERISELEEKLIGVLKELEKSKDQESKIANIGGFQVVFKDLSDFYDKLDELKTEAEKETKKEEDEFVDSIIGELQNIYKQAEKMSEGEFDKIKLEICEKLLEVCSEKLDEYEKKVKDLEREIALLKKGNAKLSADERKELEELRKSVREASKHFLNACPDIIKLRDLMKEAYVSFEKSCDQLNEVGSSLKA